MFDKNKTSLICYPAGTTGTYTIPNSVTAIGNDAFYNCTGLTSVTILENVTAIGYYAFYYCTGLTSITIPNSVTTIGIGAFIGCSVKSITIPNSVTAIGNDAFYNCTGLMSVTIANNVTAIGNGVFRNCSSLTEIHNQNAVPQNIGDNTFSTGTQQNSTLYVPVGSLSAYQNAPVWQNFWNIVEEETGSGIEEISANSISLYPNPVKNELYIEIPLFQKIEFLKNIQIYDISGRAVGVRLITPLQNTINVSHLPAGIYIVQIGTQTARFVKE